MLRQPVVNTVGPLMSEGDNQVTENMENADVLSFLCTKAWCLLQQLGLAGGGRNRGCSEMLDVHKSAGVDGVHPKALRGIVRFS